MELPAATKPTNANFVRVIRKNVQWIKVVPNDFIGTCSSELYSFNLLKLPPPPRAAILVDVRSIDTDTYDKYINHYTVFDIYAMYDVCTNWIVSIVCVLYKCILRSTSWGPMKNWKMMVSKRKFSEQPKKLPVFGEDSCSSWSGEFPVLMSKDYGQSEPASLDMAFTLKKWSNVKLCKATKKALLHIRGGCPMKYDFDYRTIPTTWLNHTMCVEKLQMMRTYNKIVQVKVLFPK